MKALIFTWTIFIIHIKVRKKKADAECFAGDWDGGTYEII